MHNIIQANLGDYARKSQERGVEENWLAVFCSSDNTPEFTVKYGFLIDLPFLWILWDLPMNMAFLMDLPLNMDFFMEFTFKYGLLWDLPIIMDFYGIHL